MPALPPVCARVPHSQPYHSPPPPRLAGAFGLLPFMALWQPPKEPPKVPAAAEDLQGPGNLMQKGMESPLVAFLCLAGAVACVGQAALAGAPQWNSYFKLLEESRSGLLRPHSWGIQGPCMARVPGLARSLACSLAQFLTGYLPLPCAGSSM